MRTKISLVLIAVFLGAFVPGKASAAPHILWTFNTTSGATVKAFDYLRKKRDVHYPSLVLQDSLYGIVVGSHVSSPSQSVSTVYFLNPVGGSASWFRVFTTAASGSTARRLVNLQAVPDKNGDHIDDIYAIFDNPTSSFTIYRQQNLLSGLNGSTIWSNDVNYPAIRGGAVFQKPLTEYDLNNDNIADIIEQTSDTQLVAEY